MALTDTGIRNVKPDDKPFKMSDEKGMFLYVASTGGKLWRLKYRFDGKEKLLSLGAYPDVSLKDARSGEMSRASSCAMGLTLARTVKYKRLQKWNGPRTVSRS